MATRMWHLWLLALLLLAGACASASDQPTPLVAPPHDAVDLGTGIEQIVTAAPNTPTAGRAPWLGQRAWEQGIVEIQTYMRDEGTQPRDRFVYTSTLGDLSLVWVFMQHVSADLGTSCQYCHDFSDRCAHDWRFGDVDTVQMAAAQQMMGLVQMINTRLQTMPGWSGALVTCGTCHQGQPTPPITATAADTQAAAVARPLRDGRGMPISTDRPALADRAVGCQGLLADMIATWDQSGALPDYWTGERRYPTCATCHLGYATPPTLITPSDLDAASTGATALLPPILRGGTTP